MARIAIVTGGSRGIGEAISLKLQEQGVTVVANYGGNDEKARAFTDRTGIKAMKWDVGDHQACLDSCARIAEELGPVDIVVNNAGITRDGTLSRMSYDDWDDVMRVNLGGCFNMAKATFGGMVERGWGRIVNIGSINGQAGQYGQVNYAAAKSGIHGFTKALAQEGAKKGVTVNAIAPGYIDTDMVAAVPAAGAGKDRCENPGRAPRPGRRNRARRCIPVQRGCRLRHGVDHEHQWRAAYVLTVAGA
jgi:acetoacetyl-CoA reductase